LKPLTAERETTFDEKFGDSDDELGDDEDSKGLVADFICVNCHKLSFLPPTHNAFLSCFCAKMSFKKCMTDNNNNNNNTKFI